MAGLSNNSILNDRVSTLIENTVSIEICFKTLFFFLDFFKTLFLQITVSK